MMARPENGNAAPAGTGDRVECLHGEVNRIDRSEIYSASQRRAAARIAARCGFSLSMALVVATLSGLGGGQVQ